MKLVFVTASVLSFLFVEATHRIVNIPWMFNKWINKGLTISSTFL
jgi:hypothetical protein